MPVADGNAVRGLNGIKYVSMHERTGYGIAARRYLRGLARSGVPLTWTPMVPGGTTAGLYYTPFKGRRVGDPELDSLCNRPIEYDVVIFHTVPEYYPMLMERERGKHVVGYTVWETDRVPRHWPEILARVDHLLVPCKWNERVFRRCGVSVPIDVIPHIAEIEEPVGRNELWGIAAENFVFYTIGMWTTRKAPWNAIDCYLQSFSRDDPVTLVVKTSQKDFCRPNLWRFKRRARSAARKVIGRYKRPAQVQLITDELSDAQMLSLHDRGDCYVSLTRSEGWGLGAFDAARFGKPVIMTGYGGQLDFLPADLAYLVDYTAVAVMDRLNAKSYSSDQTWADPDISQASEYMRLLVSDKAQGRLRGNALQSYILNHFDEKTVTDKLIRAISRRN